MLLKRYVFQHQEFHHGTLDSLAHYDPDLPASGIWYPLDSGSGILDAGSVRGGFDVR
jgi:hypothetical protein